MRNSKGKRKHIEEEYIHYGEKRFLPYVTHPKRSHITTSIGKGDFNFMDTGKIIPSTKQSGGVFPSEEAFQEIYEECLDNQPQASENTRSSYKRMGEIFDKYLCAIQEDMFRYAYRCGYEAAMHEMQKGGAA